MKTIKTLVRGPEGNTVQTVDLTPTWQALMPVLFAVLENGSEEGKKIAREEIMRLAVAVDKMNKGD